MNERDEIAFLRFLERFSFEVYPRRVPPDWVPFRARGEHHAKLPTEDVYLADTDIGPVHVDKVKRGPDKGMWRVDEVRSPVIYWERSTLNDDGEMLSGQIWAEIEITEQTGRQDPAPEKFRMRYLELERWVRAQFRRGDPKPYLVGPHTAREVNEGKRVLRVNEHKGGTVKVHR